MQKQNKENLNSGIKKRIGYLRDFIQSYIENRVYWVTVENEWQLWECTVGV